MFFKRIAIIGSFALTTVTSAVAAASGARYLRIVQLLVDGHANVDLGGSNGGTPLQRAPRRGDAAIERVLVGAGAR
ncbi:ankyrin repeat domain-containing protein [Burkholderia cepacia]|uniref:ankyrin repeat domain-containing protein n=1 Tax=Burkholderia cepacia TaxID=292 RepID=UPI0007534426|nr:ankyrin repeat domain-containing protein [Burkholderia cepacia]KVL01864.1 hypothetical protein WS93_14310 [Burkholderia cepacia]